MMGGCRALEFGGHAREAQDAVAGARPRAAGAGAWRRGGRCENESERGVNRVGDRRRYLYEPRSPSRRRRTRCGWQPTHTAAAPILRLQRRHADHARRRDALNPASCELVRSTILEEPALGAVCVELCDARFNATIASKWRRGPSFERTFFEDECQVAFEAAQDGAGLGVVLADQPIGETARRSADLLLATARDVLTPGGWRPNRRRPDLRRGGAARRRRRIAAGGRAAQGALLRGASRGGALPRGEPAGSRSCLWARLSTLDALLAAIAVDTSVVGLGARRGNCACAGRRGRGAARRPRGARARTQRCARRRDRARGARAAALSSACSA